MESINTDDAEIFGDPGVRGGGANFKRLLHGEDLTANNFELTLVQVKSRYITPKHRHNFDQVRFLLSGSFGYGKGREQATGTVGYFPEGCFYQQEAEGASCTLLLQAAGASLSPYVSFPTLRRLVGEMSKGGEFNKGVYTRYKEDGRKRNQDAYEALWERACGIPLEYPQPRYNEPIIMTPENFNWVESDGMPGVFHKKLACFTERNLEIGFVRIEVGAKHRFYGNRAGDFLFYVLSGLGTLDGTPWKSGHAIHLSAEDNVQFEAEESSELYYLRLPTRV